VRAGLSCCAGRRRDRERVLVEPSRIAADDDDTDQNAQRHHRLPTSRLGIAGGGGPPSPRIRPTRRICHLPSTYKAFSIKQYDFPSSTAVLNRNPKVNPGPISVRLRSESDVSAFVSQYDRLPSVAAVTPTP
jgi:hypothetical protein